MIATSTQSLVSNSPCTYLFYVTGPRTVITTGQAGVPVYCLWYPDEVISDKVSRVTCYIVDFYSVIIIIG